jgi:hypothetical protein
MKWDSQKVARRDSSSGSLQLGTGGRGGEQDPIVYISNSRPITARQTLCRLVLGLASHPDAPPLAPKSNSMSYHHVMARIFSTSNFEVPLFWGQKPIENSTIPPNPTATMR